MSKIVIFLLSGKAESGKDTCAEYLLGSFGLEKPIHLSFGSRVKEVATSLGWDGKKDEKGRAMLQWLGDGVKQFNPTFWVDKTIEDIKSLSKEGYTVFIISDCRYKDEIIKIKEEFQGCVYPIRVSRPTHKSRLSEEQLNHRSECDLDDYPFEYVLHNNSNLASFERNIFNLIRNIRVIHYI